MLYDPNILSLQSLEARKTGYRFDLETDIPWVDANASGLHFPNDLLNDMGIDAESLSTHPEAYQAFQWSLGLEVSLAFSTLEKYLLEFVHDENDHVLQSKSLNHLYEEEIKHIALFDRYAETLQTQKPEWVDDFKAAFEPYKPALRNPYNRGEYSDPKTRHYFFWLKTLFFEEYTLYLHERLRKHRTKLQPVWYSAHAMHRREEQQHVLTDAAYIESLKLDKSFLKGCATAFWTHFEETFTLFLGIAATRDFVSKRWPETAGWLPSVQTKDMPIFQDVLGHKLFKWTRKCAPLPATYLKWNGKPLPQYNVGTLLDSFRRTLTNNPNATIEYVTHESRLISYQELHQQAQIGANSFNHLEPGTVVFIPADNPEKFIKWFWSVLYSGNIPAPYSVASVRDDQTIKSSLVEKINSIGNHCACILPQSKQEWIEPPCRIIRPSTNNEKVGNSRERRHISADNIALVQFTSGSSGKPKPVALSHRNLITNINAIIEHQGGNQSDRFCSWLPLFHDMGLIGYHLIPLTLGSNQILIQTRRFLGRPKLWLDYLDKRKATVTASPNFGLIHTVNRCTDSDLQQLNLSSVRILLNGAEPISDTAMHSFMSKMTLAKLDTTAMTPAYGMAEASLCLTAKPIGQSPKTVHFNESKLKIGDVVTQKEKGIPFVSVGEPITGVSIQIVDANHQPIVNGRIGIIKIKGANVFRRYFNTNHRVDEWYDTGDMGVIYQNNLYITGRTKDIIVLNGQNHSAVVLDTLINDKSDTGFAHCVGFFDGHKERIGVVAIPSDDSKIEALKDTIKTQLREHYGILHSPIVILNRRQLPKTTSGKLIRADLTQFFERQTSVQPQSNQPSNKQNPTKLKSLEEMVYQAWSIALSIPESQLQPNDEFLSLGGDSIKAAHVHALLEEGTGKDIGPELLFDSNTIAKMIRFLGNNQYKVQEANINSIPKSLITVEEYPAHENAIAITGIGLRVPGASNKESFWKNLLSGNDFFKRPPTSRWNHKNLINHLNSIYGRACPTGSFMEDIFQFDAAKYGFDECEAKAINPQFRLFLECVSDAVEDAELTLKNVGLFVSHGESPSNFRTMLDQSDAGDYEQNGMLTNSVNNMIGALAAKHHGFTGGALVIQAACASSLAATHQACQALRAGDCDAAIVGGVELLHTPTLYTLFSKAGVLSNTGKCRPFSKDSDGFVPGEAAVALTLKPLRNALRDGDRIYASIIGSAIGSDGVSFGAMAPNPAGQIRVMRKALKEAKIDSSSVIAIETHGTGTPIGDLVETKAISECYDNGSPLHLTAIKSKLGHTLAAAGVLSLAKTALSLYHRCIPPMPIAEYKELEGRLNIGVTPIDLSENQVQRMAVNALGIGGVNCHMILESVERPKKPPQLWPPIIAIGNPNTTSLLNSISVLNDWSDNHQIESIHSRSMLSASAPYSNRLAAVVHSSTDIRHQSAKWRQSITNRRTGNKKILFVFPGPGSQSPGMFNNLYNTAAFKHIINRLEPLCQETLEFSLRECILGLKPLPERIDQLQALVFATSYAASQWLNSLNVYAHAALGHSGGEYAAMAYAGVLSLEDAFRALLIRAKAMKNAPPGNMLAVFSDANSIEPLLGQATIAAYNGPKQITCAGSQKSLMALKEKLDINQIAYRDLPIFCAAHSGAMMAAGSTLFERTKSLNFQTPDIHYYSSMTGSLVAKIDPFYLQDQLVRPVEFLKAANKAISDGHRIFVELGGAAIHAPNLQAIADLSHSTIDTLSLNRANQNGLDTPLTALTRLYELGVNPHWSTLYGVNRSNNPYQRQNISSYPFPLAMEQHKGTTKTPYANNKTRRLTSYDQSIFEGHKVNDLTIAPAAWMLDKLIQEYGPNVCLKNVLLTRPFEMKSPTMAYRIVQDKDSLALQSFDGKWVSHCELLLSPLSIKRHDTLDIEKKSAQIIDPTLLYSQISTAGIVHDSSFQALRKVERNQDVIWLEIECNTQHEGPINPRTLDAVFQGAAAFFSEDDSPYLGFSIGRFELYRALKNNCHATLSLKNTNLVINDSIRLDIHIRDEEGTIAVIQDFTLKRMNAKPLASLLELRKEKWIEPISHSKAQKTMVAYRGKKPNELIESLWQAGSELVLGPYLIEDDFELGKAIHSVEYLLIIEPKDVDLLSIVKQAKQKQWNGNNIVISSKESIASLCLALRSEGLNFKSIGGKFGQMSVKTLVNASFTDELPARFYLKNSDITIPQLHVRKSRQLSEGTFQSVWIIGGTGGIGRTLISKFIEKGVKRIIVSSREVSADLPKHASIRQIPMDASSLEELKNTTEQILKSISKIDLVILASGKQQASFTKELNQFQYQAILAPKSIAASNLITIAKQDCFDKIVFMSSMTALLPSPKQGAYAAANNELNHLAQIHNDKKRPVKSIVFGPWSSVGMAASKSIQQELKRIGLPSLTPKQGSRMFFNALEEDMVCPIICATNSDTIQRINMLLKRIPIRKSDHWIQSDSYSDRHPFSLMRFLSNWLNKPIDSLDADMSFSEMGIDSINAVQLVKALESELGKTFHPTLLFEHPTPSKLITALNLSQRVQIESKTESLIETLVMSILSSITKHPIEKIDSQSPFDTIGIDSLKAIEIVKHLEDQLKTPIGPTFLFEHPTPEKLIFALKALHRTSLEKPKPSEIIERVQTYATQSPITLSGPRVTIEVEAWGINFIDVLASLDAHPTGKSGGHEFSGTVVEIHGDSNLKVGDRVMALAPQDAFQKTVTTPAHLVWPIPDTMTFKTAAAIPIASMTAIACIEIHGRIEKGEKALIQSAAGATGLACVQLAKHHGAIVIGTAGHPSKRPFLNANNVDFPIIRSEGDWANNVMQEVGFVDVIIDSLSGSQISKGFQLLNLGGRFIEIAAGDLVKRPIIDPKTLFDGGLSFHGVNLSTIMPFSQKMERLHSRLMTLLNQDVFDPHIHQCFPFECKNEAIDLLKTGQTVGKVILCR